MLGSDAPDGSERDRVGPATTVDPFAATPATLKGVCALDLAGAVTGVGERSVEDLGLLA